VDRRVYDVRGLRTMESGVGKKRRCSAEVRERRTRRAQRRKLGRNRRGIPRPDKTDGAQNPRFADTVRNDGLSESAGTVGAEEVTGERE
jgi:hypothetical protein